ncbi:MAG: flagellar biosynthesis protein FlhB [Thermoguttaceae bacterium]|jgi:flagellar biosynthetic protein FlhB
MPEHDGEKSLEATPHRRQQAREQGHVAKSQDLASAAVLILGLMALMMLGSRLIDYLGGYFHEQLGGRAWLSIDAEAAVAEWQRVMFSLAWYLLPIFAAMMLSAIAANLLQVGFLLLPDKLVPDLTRLDLLQGVQRLFSLQNVARLAFGVGKLLLIAVVAVACVYGQWNTLLGMSGMSVPETAQYTAQILLWTCMKIGVALLVLAIFDFGFQRWKYEKDIRMTPQEMREEMKNLEGNPQVIARRRQVQRQLALNRLSETVPKADVVVTNPTELSIAIQYEAEKMAAPIVVAKGAGLIAQRIRRLALEHGIPIVEKKPLAQALYREVDVNHPIPESKYAAVAEVLAYVYQLKKKTTPGPARSPKGAVGE